MTPLTLETVADHLRSRGVITSGPCEVTALTGGVSNDVFQILQDDRALVMKQSLPVLRVKEHWAAPVERVLTEARALAAAGAIEPSGVPDVVDVDPDEMTLTMTRTEPALTNLRVRLLNGDIDVRTAHELGRLLGRWHAATADRADIADQFPPTYLEDLRISPYYRHAATAHPDIADQMIVLADELTSRPSCLVHGDFTPKNVLADGPRLEVLDWEVAHYGNPVFDVASTTALLMLKALRSPGRADDLRTFDATMNAAYRSHVPDADDRGLRTLTGHVGCILLARIDGRSPVDYLDEQGRDLARTVGRTLATRPLDHLDAAWELVT